LAKEAFETTGLEVKAVKLGAEYLDYDWFSYPEEWEKYIQELENLPNRCFYAKHKIEGGVLPLRTADVLPAYEELGMGKDDFERLLAELVFGRKYLLERRQKEVEKKVEEKPIEEEKEKMTTLEEIVATLTPLEKAILWAIGVGNYNSADIYEEGNKKLKEWGCSTRKYSEFKKKLYEFAELPKEGGKGLIEFTKLGRSFCYWLSKWGEIAFAQKFGMPSDRAINELGGGGKPSKAVALEVIKEWLEPQGYKVSAEEEIETDLTESGRGYTDLVAEKDGETLRIEIEHRSPKEQVETNIRKNLEYSDTLYIVASDDAAKKKVIQVALRTLFRLRKEKPERNLKVKVASIHELRESNFRNWFEVRT
jgi:hypothetical protein